MFSDPPLFRTDTSAPIERKPVVWHDELSDMKEVIKTLDAIMPPVRPDFPSFKPEIFIRRCHGNRNAWGAFVGESPGAFIITTALSLDILVATLDRSYPTGWRGIIESESRQ